MGEVVDRYDISWPGILFESILDKKFGQRKIGTCPIGSNYHITGPVENKSLLLENCNDDTPLTNEQSIPTTKLEDHSVACQSSVQLDDLEKHHTAKMGSCEQMSKLSVQMPILESRNSTSRRLSVHLNAIRNTEIDNYEDSKCKIKSLPSSTCDKRKTCFREVMQCIVIIGICMICTYLFYGLLQRRQDPIQTVRLFIDWQQMEKDDSNEKVDLIWSLPKLQITDFVRLSRNRTQVYVKYAGMYDIFAFFNLDTKSVASFNMKVMGTRVICMKRNRQKNICQRHRLAPNSAVTVPFRSMLKLQEDDYVVFTTTSFKEFYKGYKGTFLAITKY